MTIQTTEAPHAVHAHSMPAMSLAALGVVFGDIGTSPLYAMKTVLDVTPGHPPAEVLGTLSLIVWTLIVVTSLKYVVLAMHMDNDGEGGILALLALLRMKGEWSAPVVFVGLAGAALVYGDFVITPAISVLSALEGLKIVAPDLESYVLPAAVVILATLFAVQRQGTARIGRLVGPVMVLWFAMMAILGVWGIVQYPAVLWALNPLVGLGFLFSGGGSIALAQLAGVFLCVTGAEVLYADMGHFGRRPIQLVWSCFVFPALVLNYAGQAAIVLAGAPTDGGILFRLCPEPLLLPMVIMATVATVIASQAVITGAFSMTRQAIQLGLLPRLRIIQTSAAGYGQIYLPAVNWLLMIGTLSLAVGFGSSHALAAGYGIAVSATMVATTILLSIAVREIWAVPLPLALGMGIAFGVIDIAFLSANMTKLFDGGWVPLLLGSIVYLAILVWQRGNAAVNKQIDQMEIPIEDIVAQILKGDIRRVPGTAVFVARIARDIPPLVVWHLRHIRSLHETIVIINAATALVPYVAAKDRLEMREIAPQVWRAHARFGFMEQPDLPALLELLRVKGCPVDPANATYFIGHETIVPREDGKGLPLLVRNAFAFLKRNSAEAAEYFRLPRDMVVEIGRQFAI